MRLKSSLAALSALSLPPCALKNWLLRQFGWQIGIACRIGCSWIRASRVRLGSHARIGHANLIALDALFLAEGAGVGHLNRIAGPLWVVLQSNAGIGNQNRVIRAKRGVTWGRAMLKLGVWSKITSRHHVDCCRSVIFGDYTTIAGLGTQVWTHGYLHAPAGLDRFRIDGRVKIGSNVYIGSACVVNAGVSIGDGITVGAACCVSGSLLTPGLYVSQPLRMVPLDYEQAQSRHPRVHVDGLVEHVVNKHPTPRR